VAHGDGPVAPGPRSERRVTSPKVRRVEQPLRDSAWFEERRGAVVLLAALADWTAGRRLGNVIYALRYGGGGS
jgi:hypothetical protein